MFLLAGVSPAKLDRLDVPAVIQNGTVDHVVLDCPYTLEPGERDGIVLKWYLNSNTVPIYQWIPPSHPQVRTNTQQTHNVLPLNCIKLKPNLDPYIYLDPKLSTSWFQDRCD